jgi:hypothetical protein
LELFLPKKDLLQQFSHRLPQGPFKLYRNSFKKEKKKITKDKNYSDNENEFVT